MNKAIKSFFSIFLIIILTFSSHIKVHAETSLNLLSPSVILMEKSTGEILYEKDSHIKLPPASITKIMTLLLIYENERAGKFNWDDIVTISSHASSMGGSQVFLEENETQTAKDLTKCIVISSANDAAVAMAEFIAQSEDAFVDMMNNRAKELGMNDTVFKNACGLDTDGHISSAYDIALMSRELMSSFPKITEYTTTWMDTITHKTRKGETTFGLTNTNKLIKWYNGATGLKTGSTSLAKYCLSATAKRNDMELVAVIMSAPDNKSRFQEAMKLLDYGFSNYEIKSLCKKDEITGSIPVSKGLEESVNISPEKDLNTLFKKGSSEAIIIQTNIYASLTAPFEKGTKAGEIIFLTPENKEIARCDLITEKSVEKAHLFYNIKNLLKKWNI